MTTHFDETRNKRGTVGPDNRSARLSRDGLEDLASFALAQLAAGQGEIDVSMEARKALTNPTAIAMAWAMADPHSDEAEAMVAELLDAGLSVKDICLHHLTPAAQQLGQLWACDRLPFSEVTMATARMQTILRNLPAPPPMGLSGRAPGAVFASAPGETHTFGVLMAADHFRRLGWDVGVLVGVDHDTLVRKIVSDDRPLVGLSCAGHASFDALQRVVAQVQARRPDMAVVISGYVAQDEQAVAMLPECDGVIETLETAEADLEAALHWARGRQETSQLFAGAYPEASLS